MIYENLELNFEKNLFQTGFQSSNHRYTYIKDIQEDVSSFYNIHRFSLPSILSNAFGILESLSLKIVNTHYKEVFNGFTEDILVSSIKDKEFFDFIELTHNFFIPISTMYIINPYMEDKEFKEDFAPAIIAALAQATLLAQMIFNKNTTPIDVTQYHFLNYNFKNIQKQNESNVSFDEIKEKTRIEKPRSASKLNKNDNVDTEVNNMRKNNPRSYKDIKLGNISSHNTNIYE